MISIISSSSVRPWVTVCAALVLLLASVTASAQIELRSRSVSPSQETTRDFIRSLRAGSSDVRHGLIAFARHPSDNDRRDLEQLGVLVLNPLRGTVYRVRVRKQFDERAFRSNPLRPYLVGLQPDHRVNSILWGPDFTLYEPGSNGATGANWVLSEDGRFLNVTVRMQAGVTAAEAIPLVERYARRSANKPDVEKLTDGTWRMTVARACTGVIAAGCLRTLAEEDLVEWIDGAPGPFLGDNDRTRRAIGVEALHAVRAWQDGQNASAGTLSGEGVQVGLFDQGIDPHRGFDRRLIFDDPDRSQFHGTHMAGVIAGSGALEPGDHDPSVDEEMRTPFQWRGMAPRAELLDIYQQLPHGRNGFNAETHLYYIAVHGMDISNHSYAINFRSKSGLDGGYDESNRVRDALVRGDTTFSGILVPPRLHVTSAGNTGQDGYFSLNKQLKNALVVGNWVVRSWNLSRSSSRGPTHDGRIKPDVVAPGTEVVSTGYCAAADPRQDGQLGDWQCKRDGRTVQRSNFYRLISEGTSQAAAATTGALALVLEQYRNTYGIDLDRDPPLPSTLRGLMIHTARNPPKLPDTLLERREGVAWIDRKTTSRVHREREEETRNPAEFEKARRRPTFNAGWGLIDVGAAVEAVKQRHLIEDAIAATCQMVTYAFDVPPGTDGLLRVTLAWDDVAADTALKNRVPRLINDLDMVLIDPQNRRHYPWQLDQEILEPRGNQTTAGTPHCGVESSIRRLLDPLQDSLRNDLQATKLLARQGPDHLNNVEVIDAPRTPGRWQVQVTGFGVSRGPQKFSLIGQTFTARESAQLPHR